MTDELRYTSTIRELPEDDRPRERLIRCGVSALSAAELLAIQIRMGTPEHNAIALAGALLKKFGGLRGIAGATIQELSELKGIGPAKAAEVLAAVELGRRVVATSPEARVRICDPRDVANLLMEELRDARKEHFIALLLDTKMGVIKNVRVSIGTLDSSLVHPREVFVEAIRASAASIIVAHNHPSGDPTPSAEDRRVTQRLMEAGELVGIEVLDHIVIGDGRWVSLKERGMMS